MKIPWKLSLPNKQEYKSVVTGKNGGAIDCKGKVSDPWRLSQVLFIEMARTWGRFEGVSDKYTFDVLLLRL